MKKLFIVANWKSHKTSPEALSWLHESVGQDAKEVIICPPFTLLAQMHWYIGENHLSLKLGAQNVSPFEDGAYTGEVSAKQIKEFGEYVIIGHSERRNYFLETDELVAQKVRLALAQGLTPIFCVQGKETAIPEGVTIVAYEPVEAIGTGHPDTPENANEVASSIKAAHSGVTSVLYGGSVSPENVHNFTSMESIDGVLVGGASLDAATFTQLITNA